MIHGTITQITPTMSTNAFVNIDNRELYTMVWGSSYHTPVYIFMSGIAWHVIVFENEAMADEWVRDEWPKWSRGEHSQLMRIENNSIIDVT
jgi:hypothetical protein